MGKDNEERVLFVPPTEGRWWPMIAVPAEFIKIGSGVAYFDKDTPGFTDAVRWYVEELEEMGV